MPGRCSSQLTSSSNWFVPQLVSGAAGLSIQRTTRNLGHADVHIQIEVPRAEVDQLPALPGGLQQRLDSGQQCDRGNAGGVFATGEREDDSVSRFQVREI